MVKMSSANAHKYTPYEENIYMNSQLPIHTSVDKINKRDRHTGINTVFLCCLYECDRDMAPWCSSGKSVHLSAMNCH